MKTQQPKTAYLLSDGTPVREGSIVVVIVGDSFGNHAGTITKIITATKHDLFEGWVECYSDHACDRKFWERLSDLRVATKEEKKKWKKMFPPRIKE